MRPYSRVLRTRLADLALARTSSVWHPPSAKARLPSRFRPPSAAEDLIMALNGVCATLRVSRCLAAMFF